MKMIYLLTSAFLCVSIGMSIGADAQCAIPVAPTAAACGSTGTKLTATNGGDITSTYYFNGAASTFSGVKLQGGATLVVCGSLTLTSPTLNGTLILIEPGGSLTLSVANGFAINTTSIVNNGSLTITLPSPASSITMNGTFWNNGAENTEGSVTFNGSGGPYNETGASMVISGNMLTNKAAVNDGAVTVGLLYTQNSSLCLGNGSTTGLNNYDDAHGGDAITVPVGTATIGITGNFKGVSSFTAVTAAGNLTFCEGPGETNTNSNPGSATVHTNCTLNVLPITLVSFSAGAENNICTLQWTTTAQKGLVNFDIEYSTDAVTYQTLAILPAEQETDNYTYTTPIKGNTWFRLRLVNQDSSYFYSDIVPVNYQGVAGGEAFILRIRPNLITGNTLQVWSYMPTAESGEWWVVDMMGRTMMRQSAQLSQGTTTNTLQLPALSSGMYHLLFINSQVKLSPIAFSVMR
jgi:hypothetical protein